MLVKAFRLFVSSTFADFAQEREILQSRVFPALDVYCAAKGYQFLPLDLRWGINDEAQRDQRTAEICLGEVSAAKDFPHPNFLIMIGNRYGWVPLPYSIAEDEFEAVAAWHGQRGQTDAARELRLLYQRDDNCLLPAALASGQAGERPLVGAYVLRSREDELAELQAPEAWAAFEARARHALQEAADDLLAHGRINQAARDTYFLSLTEQEICRGLAGTGAHAIAFLRELGETNGDNKGSGSLLQRLMGRTSRDVPPPPGYFEREPRLDALRSAVQRALPSNSIVTAKAAFTSGGKLDEVYLASFAAAIERKLLAEIDRHIAEVSAIEQAAGFALDSEREEHRAFAEQKRNIFVGRTDNLQAIADYLSGDADHPLIVHGRSGLGKSALLARAIANADVTARAPIIYRFIGASAASSDVRSLLLSVVDELAIHGRCEKPDQFEDDANKFLDQIKTLLSSINAPVTIVLDALDQLRKPYRLGWLPDSLPLGLKLVVSVLDDHDYETDSAIYHSLRQRLSADAFVPIEPLGATEGHDILAALEDQAGRRLQPAQRDYVVALFERAEASPLYLRTAFEIARNWRSTTVQGDRLKTRRFPSCGIPNP